MGNITNIITIQYHFLFFFYFFRGLGGNKKVKQMTLLVLHIYKHIMYFFILLAPPTQILPILKK